MILSVGLVEGRRTIHVELLAPFVDEAGRVYPSGRHEISGPLSLRPEDPAGASFAIEDVTIGIGFHWQREERQVFRGALRVVEDQGLVAINDVPLDEYVTSVISSEMSASCPLELLKAHAVISRSWLLHPRSQPEAWGRGNAESRRPGEIIRWYGREAHRHFDVCADDHCQRYQGITKAFSPAATQAVAETAGELLLFRGQICDARFSKCCGGMSESYRSAWDDRDVPYLTSVYDGPPPRPAFEARAWILGDPPAYCNTEDRALLARLLPGFDQETRDFFRWTVVLTGEEIRRHVREKLGVGPRRRARARAARARGLGPDRAAAHHGRTTARSSWARSWRSGAPSRRRTSTARPSSWTRSPAASRCTAPAGATASASARSAPR